jgi:signal transduction histidine kinase
MNEVAELQRVRQKLAAIPGSATILEALFALGPVGFQIYDARGRCLLVNQAFRDLFGSEPPPEYNVLHDDIAAANGVLGLVERAFAGEVVSTPPIWYDPRELRQIKVTAGRRIAITTTFFPLRDAAGAVSHVGIVFKDVTPEMEKRAREERARVEAEFLAKCSTVLAGSLDLQSTLQTLARLTIPHLADWCIIDLVADGGTIERMATAHGDSTREELLTELQRRYPPRPDGPQPTARVLRTGVPELLAEIDEHLLATLTVDEEHRELLRGLGLRSYLAVPLVARERTLGVIGLAFAESGRRHGAEELRLARDLASQAALAIDNARLYQQARVAVRVREEFLSVAGHELRTPLTAAQIHLDLAVRAVDRAPGAQADRVYDPKKRLHDADRLLRRLAALVDQLLDVSRLGSGRLVLDVEEVDLSALAQEVIDRLKEEAARSETPLVLSAPSPVIGRWDRARLDQVLSNLLSNALKYGAGQPVDVEVRSGGDDAIVVVRDRGIGIAPESRDRIFAKFERAAPEHHIGGLGLGLWICREIVEALAGDIDVTSSLGNGAVFTVRLPRAGQIL